MKAPPRGGADALVVGRAGDVPGRAADADAPHGAAELEHAEFDFPGVAVDAVDVRYDCEDNPVAVRVEVWASRDFELEPFPQTAYAAVAYGAVHAGNDAPRELFCGDPHEAPELRLSCCNGHATTSLIVLSTFNHYRTDSSQLPKILIFP